MLSKPFDYVLVMAVLALWQPQACNTQYVLPQNVPSTGSLSKASSTASERQLQLGRVGLSRGVVNSQSVTQNNGGYGNGGTTSIANSKARTKALNLGGLNIGSTLTATKTKANDAVSRGLSHDLNIGRLNVGSSLSRDNVRNGVGLQRSPDGGLKLGLGLLNLDLSRNQQQQKSPALTQVQAQAEGQDAFAKANSHAKSVSRNFGHLGFTKTQTQSNALSGTKFGQSSAQAGGLAGRSGRSVDYTYLKNYMRSKRRAQYIPFTYPFRQDNNFDYQEANYGSRYLHKRNSNNDNFEQQSVANTHSKQESNEMGVFQNNEASSIGSNLATDGVTGQLSSASVTQDSSQTAGGSQNSNDAQSQALNFEQNQQQAVNANAGTKQLETEAGKRTEAHGGSQVTNSDGHGTSSNIANTNSQVFEENGIHGSQADSSSQSIFQGNNGQNSAAQTSSNVKSVQAADGSVSNSATSHASAVGQGGQSASAVASASASCSSGFDGSNNGLSSASSNAGSFDIFNIFSRGFASGRTGLRAFNKRQRISYAFNTQRRPQQQHQIASSLSTLEIINDSKEINWPKNRIHLYNHYPQQQRQPQLPQQREHQQPHRKHTQQLHYSSINPNSSTEQFAVIDENERHGRTLTFITDLINSVTQPTCIFPCTLEAYHNNRCCETAVVVPSPNVCCPQPWPPLILRPPTTIVRPPVILPPSSLLPPPTVAFPLIPLQCCSSCPGFGFYGPPFCTFPGGVPVHFPFSMA